MKKEEAKERYDDAVAGGNTAIYGRMDDKVPDLLNLNVG